MQTECQSANNALQAARRAVDDPNFLNETTFRACENPNCLIRAYCRRKSNETLFMEFGTSWHTGGLNLFQYLVKGVQRFLNRYQYWLINPLPSPTPPCGLNPRDYQPKDKEGLSR